MSILNLNYCVVGLGKFTIALQSFEVYFSPCCCIAAFEEFRGLTLKVLKTNYLLSSYDRTQLHSKQCLGDGNFCVAF